MPQTDPADRSANSLGLKPFNQAGSDDTSYDVIKPKATAAQKRNTVALLGVVAALIAVVSLLAFQRSGLRISDAFQEPENQRQFGVDPGARNPDAASQD